MTVTYGTGVHNWGHTRGHRLMRSSSHLMLKRGVYYARFRVPRRLLPWLDQHEIRWSLQTSHLKSARHRLHVASLLITDMLRRIAMEIAHVPLTEPEKSAIKQRIAAVKAERLEAFKRILSDGDAGPLDARDYLQQEQGWLDQLRTAITMEDFDQPEIIWPASDILPAVDRLSYDFSRNNPNFRYLARQFCTAMVSLDQDMRLLLKRQQEAALNGTHLEASSEAQNHPITSHTTVSISPLPPVASTEASPALASPAAPPALRVSALISAYLNDLAAKQLRPKTLKTYTSEYQRFVEYTHDMACHEITRDVLRDFRDAMLRYPESLTPAQRQLPFAQRLLDQPGKGTLHLATVNKYLGRLEQLFAWGRLEGHDIKDQLTTRMALVDKRRERDVRDRFSQEELTRLFSSPEYQGQKAFAKPAYYWAPLIALFAGLRAEEICQLHLADLGVEKGIHYFDICEGEGKRLKPGQATPRKVPVHSTLITLGLLDYAAELRERGHHLLFPTLNAHALNGLSHGVSRWFSTYKVQFGFGAKLCIHSLRHTLNDETLQLHMNEVLTNAVMGHVGAGTMSVRRYGKDMNIEALSDFLESVHFAVPAKPYKQCKFAAEEVKALLSPKAATALREHRIAMSAKRSQSRKATP